MSKLEVCFRVFPEGDVLAIFNSVCTGFGDLESYQHVGQHGPCHPDLVHELRPATEREYASLLRELVGIGYDNLTVVKTFEVK